MTAATMPDKHGFMSLSLSNIYEKEIIEASRHRHRRSQSRTFRERTARWNSISPTSITSSKPTIRFR
ncbi:MAG: hypothetical protein MZU97_24290 [Bacillus subtilis]|nr:hypothetical protein [Bacillus subtilis]